MVVRDNLGRSLLSQRVRTNPTHPLAIERPIERSHACALACACLGGGTTRGARPGRALTGAPSLGATVGARDNLGRSLLSQRVRTTPTHPLASERPVERSHACALASACLGGGTTRGARPGRALTGAPCVRTVAGACYSLHRAGPPSLMLTKPRQDKP